MAALQVGHRIKDNDPRQGARVLTIERVEGRFVYARTSRGLECRIQACRIYTDGKPRRTGFALLPDEQGQRWKVGNEFLPFHPDASHVPADYRDGWNACYRAALSKAGGTE